MAGILIEGKKESSKEDEVMPIAQDILTGLIGELKTLAKTETVVGSPFLAGEFTVIPISRVSLGVGAGGCGDEKKEASGKCGGGGGGIRINPVALVAVRGAELNVHTLGRGAALTHTFEKMPELVEKSLEKLFEAWAARKEK
jgi:uncharacterized spore protein YtfJ